MRQGFIYTLTVLLGMACGGSHRPINYGTDQCNLCSMTIVEEKFGAQRIASKGRLYHYDSVECLADDILREEDEPRKIFVTDFPTGALIDGKTAFFLLCEKIPSPMGAFLSAYANEQSLPQHDHSGIHKVMTWEEVLAFRSVEL